MRKLGVRLPEPPPVETDVEKSSDVLPHEQFSVEERELVEVYRLERKPIDPATVERPQVPVVTDTCPDPPIEPATPLPDPVLLPHERFAVEARKPVEVHRIERDPVEAGRQETATVETRPESRPEPASSLPDPSPVPNPRPIEERLLAPAPIGRWEEFHDRRDEPERDDRIHLAPMLLRPGSSSTLLTADLEREHRSSFLTLAVLGIAALLAVGAVLWSGSLRYRVRQQDAAMSALQEQNQKLAESLAQKSGEQMGGEQKASSALHSSADVQQNPAAIQQPSTAPDQMHRDHPNSSQAGQGATRSGRSSKAAVQSENRQGVAVPPPVQQRGYVSAQEKGSHRPRPIEAPYAPEIVPPYPTLAKPESVGTNATTSSQSASNAGTYRPPFTPGAHQQAVPVTGSDNPKTTSPNTISRATVQPAPAVPRSSPPSATNNSAPASSSYNATQYDAGIGSNANLLAQNIEAVEGLQRHSPVQLREFHAHAGASTPATPNVRLSVQPDQGRGSYALVVSGGGSSYQLRGEVNQPLVFTDTATHREYALVVLRIADQQVYGYVRANVKQ